MNLKSKSAVLFAAACAASALSLAPRALATRPPSEGALASSGTEHAVGAYAVSQAPDASVVELLRALTDPRRQPLDSERHAQAIDVVRFAGADGSRANVPLLWELADRVSEGDAQLVALEALDALWRLGEPAAKFESRLDLVSTSPNLARFSMSVLGRSLQPQQLERLRSTARAAVAAKRHDAHLFQWSVARAELAMTLAHSFDRAPSLQAKVDLVAPQSLGSYSPFLSICGGFEAPLTSADPLTVVARAKLHELSAAAPEAVVAALRNSEMGGLVGIELGPDPAARTAILDAFRDHAAASLAPIARAQYAGLRPQAFDHPSHR